MPAEITPDVGLIVAEPAGRYLARPPLVVDCNVLAAVLFDEPERDSAAQAMAGKELFAPDLIDHELVSVALKKSRPGREAVIRVGLADFAELQMTRCRVDALSQRQLAMDYGLSAYDAAYLCLAAQLQAPLVTFDRRLGEVARQVLGTR